MSSRITNHVSRITYHESRITYHESRISFLLPMQTADVVFSLTGDVRRNTRALKQLRALAALGCRVEVLSFGPPPATPVREPGLRLQIIDQPPGGGPRFFARVHHRYRQAAQAIQAHVYHASDLYTLPAMVAAARRHGGRVVYDARDCYPHVAATAGRPWVRRTWQAVERRYIRHADAVLTVSESIADHLAAAYILPPPLVLYNAPPFQHVPRTDALQTRAGLPPETTVILHQGQMRQDRGCAPLVVAMTRVRGAVLVFLGDGPFKPALVQQVEAAGLQDRVRFLDPVPPDHLLPLTASADIGVTLLEDTCLNHRYALPNKLFEYLMAGLPVLASDLPEMRRVIESHDVGRVVNPSDPDALAGALQEMIDDAPARAHWRANTSHVFETFSWEKASQHFIRMYQHLLSKQGRS